MGNCGTIRWNLNNRNSFSFSTPVTKRSRSIFSTNPAAYTYRPTRRGVYTRWSRCGIYSGWLGYHTHGTRLYMDVFVRSRDPMYMVRMYCVYNIIPIYAQCTTSCGRVDGINAAGKHPRGYWVRFTYSRSTLLPIARYIMYCIYNTVYVIYAQNETPSSQ